MLPNKRFAQFQKGLEEGLCIFGNLHEETRVLRHQYLEPLLNIREKRSQNGAALFLYETY